MEEVDRRPRLRDTLQELWVIAKGLGLIALALGALLAIFAAPPSIVPIGAAVVFVFACMS